MFWTFMWILLVWNNGVLAVLFPKCLQIQQQLKCENHLVSSTSSMKCNSKLSNNGNKTHLTTYIAECSMPMDYGVFKMKSFIYNSSEHQDLQPLVVIAGELKNKDNVVVRVHDACLTSEVFGSKRCDCKEQLQQSLELIKQTDGIVIYLQQEGRGIGIANKIAAYGVQDTLGMDTVDANLHLGLNDECREYRCVPDILNHLGIRSIHIVTNNPFKIQQLTDLGVNITNRIPIEVTANVHNSRYLNSKRLRMNHFLKAQDVVPCASPITCPSMENVSPSDSLAKLAMVTSELRDSSSKGGYEFGKSSVLAAIKAISEGQVVVVTDDADRENEGDLIMAAQFATSKTVGFMVRHTSGVLCISLSGERLDALRLPPMVSHNEDPKGTAYSVSVDSRHNTTTGISAADRAHTFRDLVDPSRGPADFQRPGHVFPLRYAEGGVLTRGGHTEASLDLCRLAGVRLGGVLAEIVHDDGSMQRLSALRDFAVQHGLVLTSVRDIAAFRREMEGK